MLWTASALQRVSHCGRVPVSNSGHVSLRSRGPLAGYAGLQHCGSVWACPVCAARILVHRALEIGSVLGEAIRQGHPLGFVTLTMRHHQGQALDQLWSAGSKGWTRAITGKGWVAVDHLVDGWVRIWEVTHGRNGWHVHVHCVVVLAPGSVAEDLDRVAGGMWGRWSRGLQSAGLEAPLLVGQDWHMVTGDDAADALGEYLAKSVSVIDTGGPTSRSDVDTRAVSDGLGLELTHGMAGRARDGLATQPVWSLLDGMAETGDLPAWREWEKASKGKRQVGWSVGLRDRFAPSIEDLSDQAIVDQAVGDETDDLVLWTADEWRTFVAHPTRPVELLDAAQSGGRDAVQALLTRWGDVACSVVEWRGSGGAAPGGAWVPTGPGDPPSG